MLTFYWLPRSVNPVVMLAFEFYTAAAAAAVAATRRHKVCVYSTVTAPLPTMNTVDAAAAAAAAAALPLLLLLILLCCF